MEHSTLTLSIPEPVGFPHTKSPGTPAGVRQLQFQLCLPTAPACSVSHPLPRCSNAIPYHLHPIVSSYYDCLILKCYSSFKTHFKYHFLWTLATPDKQVALFPVYTLPAIKSSITLIIFTLNHLLYIPPSSKLKFFQMKNFLFIIIAPMPEV